MDLIRRPQSTSTTSHGAASRERIGPRRLKPGTVLLREYQGERHTITVVANGYLWRETTYASPSTIARAITGTAWSGPRFWPLQRHERIFVRGAAPADQVLLTETSQPRCGFKNRLDFCRKGRIAMGAGRWT